MQGLLLSNSLVLKQESNYVEYYYRALQPWQHYAPFYVTSADDLLQVLPNISSHDAAAQRIAQHGQAFAHAHLHVDARMCYWRRLLHGWSKRLSYKPDPAEWADARPMRTSDYVCGECRRPPNRECHVPVPRDSNPRALLQLPLLFRLLTG